MGFELIMLNFWLCYVQLVDKQCMQGAKEFWNDAPQESCEYRQAEQFGLHRVSRLLIMFFIIHSPDLLIFNRTRQERGKYGYCLERVASQIFLSLKNESVKDDLFVCFSS